MKITQNIGMLLLAIFLIAYAVTTFPLFAIPPILLAILAGAAGVLILIGK